MVCASSSCWCRKPCWRMRAPPACSPDIVGSWTGQVLDGGQIKKLHTEFSTASGELTGTYHVEDADGGYDGTLTDFTPSGALRGPVPLARPQRHGRGPG